MAAFIKNPKEQFGITAGTHIVDDVYGYIPEDTFILDEEGRLLSETTGEPLEIDDASVRISPWETTGDEEITVLYHEVIIMDNVISHVNRDSVENDLQHTYIDEAKNDRLFNDWGIDV